MLRRPHCRLALHRWASHRRVYRPPWSPRSCGRRPGAAPAVAGGPPAQAGVPPAPPQGPQARPARAGSSSSRDITITTCIRKNEEGAAVSAHHAAEESPVGHASICRCSRGTASRPLMKAVPISELGIACPVIINDADHGRRPRESRRGIRSRPRKETVQLRKYDFTVQFCWQETPPSKRRAKRKKRPEMPPPAAAVP